MSKEQNKKYYFFNPKVRKLTKYVFFKTHSIWLVHCNYLIPNIFLIIIICGYSGCDVNGAKNEFFK